MCLLWNINEVTNYLSKSAVLVILSDSQGHSHTASFHMRFLYKCTAVDRVVDS